MFGYCKNFLEFAPFFYGPRKTAGHSNTRGSHVGLGLGDEVLKDFT